MKKIITVLLSAAMLCTAFAACSESGTDSDSSTSSSTSSTSSSEESDDLSSLSGEATASGSSALKPLADIAVELFADVAPDALVTVNAGGSGTGLSEVSQGIVDIGNSDVAAETKLTAEESAELVDHKVCTVTMAACVNTELGLTSISQEDLIAIYTGEITNWKDVEGCDVDLEITLYTRPSSSGTRAIFQMFALNGNDEIVGMENDNSGEVQTAIKDDISAIGYLAMSYYMTDENLQALAIDGVEPTLENTYNGTYPVWGYEHMYTKGEAEGVAAAFIDFMMGEDFASEIEAAFYGVTANISDEAIEAHDAVEAAAAE